MYLIGISGKKRTGKNTVADLIESHYKIAYGEDKIKVEQIAFADSLKEEVCNACGVTRHELNENKDKFRLILQGWGTDFRRSYDNDYWVKKVLFKLTRTDADVVIIPDVRFLNEAQMIKDSGGLLFRVFRTLESNIDKHPSETSLDNYDKFDHIIYNETSIEDLRKLINKLLFDFKLTKHNLTAENV